MYGVAPYGSGYGMMPSPWEQSHMGGKGGYGYGKGGYGGKGGGGTAKICYTWRDTGSCPKGDACGFKHEGPGLGGQQKLTGTGEKKETVVGGKVVDFADAETKGGVSLTVWEETFVVKALTEEIKDNEGRERLKWRCGFVPGNIFREALEVMCMLHPTAKDKDGNEIGVSKSTELVKEVLQLLKSKGVHGVQLSFQQEEAVKNDVDNLKDIVKNLADQRKEDEEERKKRDEEQRRRDEDERRRQQQERELQREQTDKITDLLRQTVTRQKGSPMTPIERRPRKLGGGRRSSGATFFGSGSAASSCGATAGSLSASSGIFAFGSGGAGSGLMTDGRRVPTAGGGAAADAAAEGQRSALASNLFPDAGEEIPVETDSEEEAEGAMPGMGLIPGLPSMDGGAAANGNGGNGGELPPPNPNGTLPSEAHGWEAVKYVTAAYEHHMTTYKHAVQKNQVPFVATDPTPGDFATLLPQKALSPGFIPVQASPNNMGSLAMMLMPKDVQLAAEQVLPTLLNIIKVSGKPVKRLQAILLQHGIELVGGATFKRAVITLSMSLAKDIRLSQAGPGASGAAAS